MDEPAKEQDDKALLGNCMTVVCLGCAHPLKATWITQRILSVPGNWGAGNVQVPLSAYIFMEDSGILLLSGTHHLDPKGSADIPDRESGSYILSI